MDRISFISGLACHDGDILREYVSTHYEIVHFIYDLINNYNGSDVSVLSSDNNQMTIKMNLPIKSEKAMGCIRSNIENMNLINSCGKLLGINIISVEIGSIVIKLYTMS